MCDKIVNDELWDRTVYLGVVSDPESPVVVVWGVRGEDHQEGAVFGVEGGGGIPWPAPRHQLRGEAADTYRELYNIAVM